MTQEFKKDDIVEAYGVQGRIVTIGDPDYWTFPILVNFDSGAQISFTLEGFEETWHKKPSLKLIERPKKLTFKTEQFWGAYANATKQLLPQLADSKEDILEIYTSTHTTPVLVTLTYEGEE